MKTTLSFALSALLACLANCSPSSSPSATPCVPGTSIACAGPGACAGFQVCLPDGSGFAACECALDSSIGDVHTDSPSSSDADGSSPSDADGSSPSDADGSSPSDADGSSPSDADGSSSSDADGSTDSGCGSTSPHVPTTLATGSPTSLAADDTGAVWTDDAGTVAWFGVGATAPTTVASGQSSPANAAVGTTNVYWSTASPSFAVVAVAKVGGATSILASPAVAIKSIAVGPTRLYFSASSAPCGSIAYNSWLWSTKLDSADVGAVAGPVTCFGSLGAASLSVSGGYVYAGIYFSPGSIRRVPIAGGTTTSVSVPWGLPFNLVAMTTDLYWIDTNVGPSQILEADPALAASKVMADTDDARGLAADSTYLYWTENPSGKGVLRRMLRTGGCIETLVAGTETFGSVAVDATHIYWLTPTKVLSILK